MITTLNPHKCPANNNMERAFADTDNVVGHGKRACKLTPDKTDPRRWTVEANGSKLELLDVIEVRTFPSKETR